MAVINDTYYQHIATQLRDCTVAEFGNVMAAHKADILAAKFRESSEKIFSQNLSWLAQEVITQPGTRRFKAADDITDADMQKLEILRTAYDFDYMKDLRLNFTSTQDNRRLEYTQPLLTYLAAKTADFTDVQTEIMKQLLLRLEREKTPWSLDIGYAMHSGKGNNHNDSKNIFHVLMEGELTPNKKAIADLIPDEQTKKPYRIYAATSSWEGSYGQTISQTWDTYRNALHSAVASGRIENVQYALAKGIEQTTLYNSYGSTAFADAAERSHDPAYHAIARLLFENAMTLENGDKILREPSRWDKSGQRPIETLARLGDLDFTIAMAQANAGAPELVAQAFNYSARVTLGGYYSCSGNDVVHHAPIETTRTKTEWQVVETGKMENPFPYIRQAVFNLGAGGGSYSTYQDIFGLALKHLVEKGALRAESIPADSLSDPRSMNFIHSLRAVALAEKERDPTFLVKTAVFTDSFTAAVEKAAACTNNFRIVYDPKNPEATRAKAYNVQNFTSQKPIAVKPPRRFKKAAE